MSMKPYLLDNHNKIAIYMLISFKVNYILYKIEK